MIFLASPYTDPDPRVRRARYRAAVAFCARHVLHDQEHRPIFSPIVHSHPVAEAAPALQKEPTEFWMALNAPFLEAASQLWVLGLSGWEKSEGIAAERAAAETRGIPVRLYEPKGFAGTWERLS